ncbi:MAG: pantetheine-phosphate adenylyltransferase [Verrucomicrobiales bacterium]|nr:pantetheine-phosphate adenylyltransferase [Verrucomicrobiales bacterium]MBL68863.1 pantetheine-phosphate adenylyltransferase [Verrucomicrobiales bacterium]|tara:strand:- start:651 stop:1139 length:489 start_codon:yes stop_codon:yes gene_type:complete
MRTVIYPGSFDPPTLGHVDVIGRAARLFDRVIVAVADNRGKRPLFTKVERGRLLKQEVKAFANVEVDSFKGLLVDYAARMDACAIIRGLRAVSDFEYEFQMALVNRRLADQVETIFMMPRGKYIYLSSSLVKEVASLGGEVSAFVPAAVEAALRKKLRAKKR